MERKFYICSVGEKDKGYVEENLERCIENTGHFMHRDTKHKGCFDLIKPDDIVFLRYSNKNLIAFGEVTKTDSSPKEDLGEWNYAVYVKEWYFFDKKNPTRGVPRYGVKEATILGDQYATIKEVEGDFALQKMEDIAGEDNGLVIKIKKEMIMGTTISEMTNILKSSHNIILTGAPGTGKTYSTAAIALAILNVKDVQFNDHKSVMEKYNSLLEDQIFFTTFHQSLDYEDFVEGLKPRILTDKDGNSIGVTYEPENGIFKRACEAVQTDDSINIVECIDDYLQKIKGFANKKEIPTISGKSSLYVWWKEGNSTISSRSKFSTSTKDEEYTPSPLNIEKIKLQALGKGGENNWPQYAQAFIEAVKREYKVNADKPVVLIIDEINRGNVSKILGELITLLEADKRIGGEHPIKVTLPYSKTLFGVPSNLYIIGTMNSTDRSTGSIDYALRRRFAFVTLKSDVSVIENYYIDLGDEELKEISVALFNDIRRFIDEHNHIGGEFGIDDLMVGHSYFMAKSKEELLDKIKYAVIPLISEYINDGILNVEIEEKNKYFDSWARLKIINKEDDDEE